MKQELPRQYPIRTVSEMTGVNAVTLRAWERRYGFIQPLRTPKGHRLYTDEHVQLINHVCELLSAGRSISHIADELRQQGSAANDEHNVWDVYQQRMLDCISRYDERCLDSVYSEANAVYPVDVVTRQLIVPLLHTIGERWRKREGSVAEEHFFSVYLRNKIGARFHHQNNQNQGELLVAACLPGELHEFGLLLFALSAHSRGYRIILLGANMPLEELSRVAEVSACDGIVLTGSAHLDCSELKQDLGKLCADSSVPVFIGGDAIGQCSELIQHDCLHDIGTDITDSVNRISTLMKQNS